MTRALTIASATLPGTYVEARNALAKCERIDECKSWADKAAALASYAKQADDDRMLAMARRIQCRAIERGGELLAAVKAAKGGDRGGGRPSKDGNQRGGASPLVSRQSFAKDAGLSPDQAKTMLRVVNVPPAIRNAMIESAKPPTVQELADRGRRRIVKPAPYRDEWCDWVFGVRRLVKIPECGLRVLAQHKLTQRAAVLEEARSAQRNLTKWINELEKE
jgi:hypothetical protein